MIPVISKIRVPNPNKKSAIIQNMNYLKYIATRDGVDLSEPVLDGVMDSSNELYLQYIHERPGSHGLFGNFVDVYDIEKTAKHIADETAKGKCIYRGIISLTEEDALNLGYDHKEKWMELLNNVIGDVGKEFGIPESYLSFCGAVHKEAGHPHLHYMFWDERDDKIRSPYIHVSKQNRIREMISGVINEEAIQQEILNKTLKRDLILDLNRELLENEFDEIITNRDKISGRIKSSDIDSVAAELLKLTENIPDTGRVAYKFMPPDVKEKVNSLVEQVLEIPNIKIEYEKYVDSINNISKGYSASESHTGYTEDKNIQDIKKRLANQVLKTCKKLRDIGTGIDYAGEPEEKIKNAEIDEETDIDYKADWNKPYKKAIKDLYDPSVKNIDKVIKTLYNESLNGNVLAMHDLGKIYARGIKTEKNPELADKYYKSAFKGFKNLAENDEKKKQYYNYRLGKMYEAGNGTEQDYEKAISCYHAAGKNKYAQYSLASMYLRHKGIEVLPDNEEYYYSKAIELLKQSAENDNVFASYTLSKNSEDRNILNLSKEYIDNHYTIAAGGFEKMMKDTENDFLLYRLGTMYYDGKGVVQDDKKAFEYFRRSADMNNPNALYAMGKYYADKSMDMYDPVQAEKYFQDSIKEGNDFAQYSLAMLYADTSSVLYNPNLTVKLLEEIAGENVSAKYQLGKMYVDVASGVCNMEKGIRLLEDCSALNNTNAMYQLGKIYTDRESNFYNIHRGMEYLNEAAKKGNSYALAKIGSIYLWGKYEPDIKKNPELGLKYLNDAALQGNEQAQDMLNFYENYKNSITPSLSYSMLQGINRIISQTGSSPQQEESLKKNARQSKEYKKVQARLHKHGQEME